MMCMIYVVKSLSTDPEIKKLDGLLHKIGFTAGKMEVRIQNAKDDPTFLMAPVHPVTTYTLYNIDKVKLEHLLHNFSPMHGSISKLPTASARK